MQATAALLAFGLDPRAAFAAADDYTFDPGRGAFAFFESRDGDDRTETVVFATRSDGDGPDGNLDKSVALVWTTTWNSKKDKVRRVAFGAAENSKVKVNVASDLSTASVSGEIKVYDVVKDEKYTLELDVSWTKNDSKNNLNFRETYSPEPDPAYFARVQMDGDAREAKATGSVLRGNTDLTPKSASDAYITDLDDSRVTFGYPE